MKRITLLTILLVFAFFVVQAQAKKTKNVVVVNDTGNPVPVTMDAVTVEVKDATVTVLNDQSNPVPVTMGAATVTVANSPSNPVPVQGDVQVTNQVDITGGVEVTNTPLNVNLVNSSESYEYAVLRYENFDPGSATANFQEGLNTYASEGWEFVSWWHFVPVADTGGVGKWLYIAIMRRPL